MNIEENTMTLCKDELVALLAFACHYSDRPRIHGLAFEPERRRVFATDGHRAVIVRMPGEWPAEGQSFLVPLADLQRAVKLVPKKGLLEVAISRACSVDESPTCVLTVIDEYMQRVVTVQATLAKAQPPPVDNVIPRIDLGADRVAWAHLNARYLSDLAKVQRAAEADSVRCWAPTAVHAPVLFEVDGSSGVLWTVVIMPNRTTGDVPVLVVRTLP